MQYTKWNMLIPKEEFEEELKNKTSMTSIDLLYWKNARQTQSFPSSFTLIHPAQNLNPQEVSLSHLEDVHFPVLQYKVKDLIDFSCKIIKTSHFARDSLPENMTYKLIRLIAENYNSVAYHNFSHGFTLSLLNYQCLTKQPSIKQLYTEEQYFFILIAGLAHDLNHRGTNNDFQIKTNSDLTRTFNNHSVLQNMHIRTLWKILAQNDQVNFLKLVSDSTKAKQIITRLILNTDMAFHFQNLSKLQQLKKQQKFNPNQNQEHKWFLMQQIFHACDVGNPCQQYNNYISWAALLSHQFNEQTRKEQQRDLPITRCFVYGGLQSLYKDQIWFLGCIVQPLWKEIVQICPGVYEYLENIQSNRKRVNEQLAKITQ